MNDYEGTRNFEPVQPEEPQKTPKNKSSDPKRKITIAIFAIVIAIVILFCAVIITKIVYKINDSDKDDSDTPVEYKTKSVSSSDINSGNLILTGSIGSSDIEVSDLTSTAPTDEGNPYYIGTGKYPMDRLTSDTVKALKSMAKALHSDTEVRFVIAYAYDADASGEEQDHVLGTVVDIKEFSKKNDDGSIKSSALSDEAADWLRTNCAKYGFIISLTHSDGSTQLRYVGVPHATYIVKNDLSLSQYIALLEDYSQGSPLSVKGNDGNKYSVYYAKSTGEETDVKVPQNYGYDISGNGSDGFIITVNLEK